MPIWLHLPILIVVEAALSLGIGFGCVAVILGPLFVLQERVGPQGMGAWPLLALLPGFLLGWWATRRSRGAIRATFRDVVPARCPVCRNVAAFAHGSRPLRYECKMCSAKTSTGVYERGGVGED